MTRPPRPPGVPFQSTPRTQQRNRRTFSAAAVVPQAPSLAQVEPERRVLDHLNNQISMLRAQVDRLNRELTESRLHAQFVAESVFNIRQEELDRAREKGHREVLDEIGLLWRSENFGTELLIGINCFFSGF